jgi:hypothetical protein
MANSIAVSLWASLLAKAPCTKGQDSDTCTFVPQLFDMFFHTLKDLQSARAESAARDSLRPAERKFGKPSSFGLHLFWNVRAFHVNSGENLPFSFCFFTIREYRGIREHRA